MEVTAATADVACVVHSNKVLLTFRTIIKKRRAMATYVKGIVRDDITEAGDDPEIVVHSYVSLLTSLFHQQL